MFLRHNDRPEPARKPAEHVRLAGLPETPPKVEPVRAAAEPARAPAGSEQSNVLIVGQGIRLKGEITACDRLVVEGHVEVSLNETRALEIKPSGEFIGSCEVEEAEISGVYDGELTVREALLVRAGGKVNGRIKYGALELERGGRIAGDLSVSDKARAAGPRSPGGPRERPEPRPAARKIA